MCVCVYMYMCEYLDGLTSPSPRRGVWGVSVFTQTLDRRRGGRAHMRTLFPFPSTSNKSTPNGRTPPLTLTLSPPTTPYTYPTGRGGGGRHDVGGAPGGRDPEAGQDLCGGRAAPPGTHTCRGGGYVHTRVSVCIGHVLEEGESAGVVRAYVSERSKRSENQPLPPEKRNTHPYHPYPQHLTPDYHPGAAPLPVPGGGAAAGALHRHHGSGRGGAYMYTHMYTRMCGCVVYRLSLAGEWVSTFYVAHL